MIDSIAIAVDIAVAFISNNPMPADEVPGLIHAVHASVAAIEINVAAQAQPAPLTPAVPIKRSVQKGYIISLEDGKRYQTLKRHLATLGMTPGDYRAKWGLAADYPVTAPNYSDRRSALAKASGLGRKPRSKKKTKRKPTRPLSVAEN